MSSTNKTTYYDLSQYVGTDIINPLTDFNSDNEKIDTALHNIAEVAGSSAADITTLSGRVTTAESNISALETQNGSDVLVTTAQTLSGAINELKGVNDTQNATISAQNLTIDNHTAKISAIESAIETENDAIDVLKDNGNWRTGLRFKNLGTSFTSVQAAALANNDFSEFWNGDYWVINGHNWRIVDNSGWARRKGNIDFDSPSLVIMPDDLLVAAEAYLIDGGTSSSDTDTHGYANCGYRTDEISGKGRTQCKTLFQNAFGSSHIAIHKELMTTSRGTGGARAWNWQDADVELPSEVNIYGHSAWSNTLDNGIDEPGFNIASNWGQFMLFRLAPYMAISRDISYWLRDIHSASEFASVSGRGSSDCHTPSEASVGLRPYSIII